MATKKDLLLRLTGLLRGEEIRSNCLTAASLLDGRLARSDTTCFHNILLIITRLRGVPHAQSPT